MTAELAKILDHIDKIGELDLAAVEPTAHVLAVTDVAAPRQAAAQPARVTRRSRNAPAVADDCFRVPRMQS